MEHKRTENLYGECMDGRLKQHKRDSLLHSGIDPDKKYDELSWAGLCRSMAVAFIAGSGELYEFFKENLRASFEDHGVERATWAFHDMCLAYGENNRLMELMLQLEDVIAVYDFIHAKWPDVKFQILRQKLLDLEGEKIQLSIMNVEQARAELAKIREALTKEDGVECKCTG